LAAKLNRDLLRKMYTDGMSVEEIATVYSVTTPAIYYHKNIDTKEGVNWDDLLLLKSRDSQSIDIKEKEFLATLITSFEKTIKTLEEVEDVEKRLSILERYTKSYYTLKAPLKTDCKTQVSEAITTTIHTISSLALSSKSKEVIMFLSDHTDTIIAEVFKNGRK